MRSRQSNSKEPRRGFTRIELLVTLATLALLAAVTRPIWASGGATKSLACMDNLRRLSVAWLLYADDNAGKFVGNYHGGFVPTPTAKDRPWVTGWLDWFKSSANTNRTYLTSPGYAALAAYLEADASLFKCPEDEFLSSEQAEAGWVERVRSYSMGCAIGEGNATTGPWNSSLLQVKAASGFGRNRPQSAFVFIEEHPDSINDAFLFVPNSLWNLPDLPGSLHGGAGWLTFADGHLELRHWQSLEFQRPVSTVWYANNIAVQPGNPDVQWLLDHTPKR